MQIEHERIFRAVAIALRHEELPRSRDTIDLERAVDGFGAQELREGNEREQESKRHRFHADRSRFAFEDDRIIEDSPHRTQELARETESGKSSLRNFIPEGRSMI